MNQKEGDDDPPFKRKVVLCQNLDELLSRWRNLGEL